MMPEWWEDYSQAELDEILGDIRGRKEAFIGGHSTHGPPREFLRYKPGPQSSLREQLLFDIEVEDEPEEEVVRHFARKLMSRGGWKQKAAETHVRNILKKAKERGEV